MKTSSLSSLFVIATLLLGGPSLGVADTGTQAYLLFSCDGTAREGQFLREQSGTWIVQQSRALAPQLGWAVYRVAVGRAALDRLRLEVNVLPYRLEFSADGTNWENLVSKTGMASQPMEFVTQDTGFTAAQSAAASASGYAWFRIRPATESASEFLQLRTFRLEVRGAEVPPLFVRPAWWRGLQPFAAGPLMMAVGLVPVLLCWRRWGASWRVWAAGAALWVVSVALKFGFAALANEPVRRSLHAALPQVWANWTLWSYVGLLTGIFECGIFLVVARPIQRKPWTLGEALALGLAFGAFEAVALGVGCTIAASLMGTGLGVITWSQALVGAFERVLTLPIHAAAVVMILRALLERHWRWFWASVVYKSAVDGVAAWLTLSGTRLFDHLWLREWVCFAPFTLLGLGVLWFLARTWSAPAKDRVAESPAAVGPA